MARLKLLAAVTSVSIGGVQYDADEHGTIEVDTPEHVETLVLEFGCTNADPVKFPPTPDDKVLKVGDKVVFPDDNDPPKPITGVVSKITKRNITITSGEGDDEVVWEIPVADKETIELIKE